MKQPEVSVVLAVYNEDRLQECLATLAKQTGVAYEVIVVDDGSINRIKKQELKIKDKKFRFFRIKHSGPAKARNFGAKKARGKILVFLDGDMKFPKNFLNKLSQPIRQKKAKGTFSTEELVANWENVWSRCWNWENRLPDGRRIDPNRVDMVKDFRAILKSEFEKVDGFEDIGYTDTWTLAKKLGYRPFPVKVKHWHYNPETLNEVFRQAVWIGGRKRRWGVLGKIIALFRAAMPVSIVFGLAIGVVKREPKFLLFKVVYDLGIFTGIIGSL